MLSKIFKILKNRKKKRKDNSYTLDLIKCPELIRRKIIEESYELVIESIKSKICKSNIVKEICDLIYHILAYTIYYEISYQSIKNEFIKRLKPN
ncbi:phosphoribosyl-ATP diphosphatase [Candidatus Vidania fulgoroideorum]